MPDVLVVGAGVIGAACAWRLAQAGARVTLLDRSAPGGEASQAALGVLTFHAKPGMPAHFQEASWRSRDYYPAIIEELEEATGTRVDYQAGGQLALALAPTDLAELEAALAASRAAGIAVEQPTPAECRLLEPGVGPDLAGALFFPDDAWVDNTALTLEIVRAAQACGATFERAEVRAIVSRAGRVTGVRSNGRTHSADWVVLAAGCWSAQIEGVPSLPVAPVRGQALAVEGQFVRRVVSSPRGYLVPKGTQQTLVGATVEHVGFDASTTVGGVREVCAAGVELAPRLAQGPLLSTWAGLRPATPDHLPYIGPFRGLPNLIAATGHFRNGILLAPLTAAIVCALVTGGAPPMDCQPFAPDRTLHEPGRAPVGASTE